MYIIRKILISILVTFFIVSGIVCLFQDGMRDGEESNPPCNIDEVR